MKANSLFIHTGSDGKTECLACRGEKILRDYRPRFTSRKRLQRLLNTSVTYVSVGPHGVTVKILRGVG